MIYKIYTVKDDKLLIEKALVARTFFQRFLGLIPRKGIASDEALIFYNAVSIHMFFMRFPIDVVFLDPEDKIIKIVTGLKPWRLANCFPAKVTIEMRAGKAEESGLVVGDKLNFARY
ncbi:MAG: DUF192 domain-containing protein [Candidatus Omnitrophica bacterium]|nr:DUF192 domain-containing protein [Candidatus Omnitrophota bacterium]